MHKGLLVSALLATFLAAPVAMADRTESDQHSSSRSKAIKEQVLDKQREGLKGSRAATTTRGGSDFSKAQDRMRPRGEMYGDQATRGSSSRGAATVARNNSATGAVNSPSEIRAMKRLINPMYGAYRTSQASEGTDSYGGESMVPSGKGAGQKNMSATGSVTTPKEIQGMLGMFHANRGAAAAGGGTDSYGGKSMRHAFDPSHRPKTGVHFQNERGEVTKSLAGFSNTAQKSKARERANAIVKAKLDAAKSK
ncbi:MAG: hypothetical protein HOV80_34605 [Polyangiaceae bacterium]|nr:hypothetical protein [Polyangiaceae bacterium]